MSNTNLYSTIDAIKCPLITDKSTRLLDNNQYTFLVDPSLTKLEIKETIEFLFKVKIVKVNTCRMAVKKRRVGQFVGKKPTYKKATVKLIDTDTINLFS